MKLRKRPKRFDFDLIVIGSGPGGEVAANLTARAGKKVALIEEDTPGGECPNFGCVPTKSLLYAADIYKSIRTAKKFGIHAEARLNYHELKAWKDTAVFRTGTSQAGKIYKAQGIQAIKGRAEFVSPWSVSVRGRELTARHFLISTGSRSFIPPIEGLEESGFITFREAINLTKLPKSVFVIGGGAIGCEFAELFSSLGSKVAIAEVAPQLMALEDTEVGEFMNQNFQNKGIHVFTGSKVVRVEKHGQQRTVYVEQAGKIRQMTVETVLVAAGKAPNVELSLEAAGVRYSRRGVAVDKFMQTSNKHIYAAGDVVGPYCFTHMAAYQGRLSAHNMLHPKQKLVADYSAVPRCVFVDPEVAAAGETECNLRERGVMCYSAIVPISFLGRANTSDVSEGFVKVISDKGGRLIGATVVCPRAGEVIHELALAIKHRLTVHDISETIHAYPTWSEAVRYACNKLSLEL